jgi:hypothetical protein
VIPLQNSKTPTCRNASRGLLDYIWNGITNVHSLRIEPHDRHGEGGLTEGNGAKACLAVNDAIYKNGYPSARLDKVKQCVKLRYANLLEDILIYRKQRKSPY